MNPGATLFVRMLSLAHSQARFLVSWFIAPEDEEEEDDDVEQLMEGKCSTNCQLHLYLWSLHRH